MISQNRVSELPLLFPAGVSLREQGNVNDPVPGCGSAPAQKGETGPAFLSIFLSINEQVCYCHFLKHKMEIPGTYLSLRFRMECVERATDERWEPMSIADGMKDIVEDIEHSRTERENDVGEIRSAAQNMIHSFTSERKHNATDMRRTLRKGRKALGRETQDMLGGFSANRMAMARDFTTQLKKDVTGIRLDAVNMVHGFADERLANEIALSRMLKSYHDERLSNGIELSRMLKSYHDGITHDVQQLMDDFDRQRIPFQEDLAEAHGIWQSHMSHEHPGARPKIKTVYRAPKATRNEREWPEQAPNHDLKEKILKVINKSPKGISLTKAGKKIGVEWRTLIRPAKELLEVGDVRKKDTYYFPT
jgi:hypothetical protein